MTARWTLLCVLFAALLPISDVLPGEKHADVLEVAVAQPVVREVTDHAEMGGRAEASARVQLRSLVTGLLTAVRFKDGEQVKQGDVLFEIDPRPYQARVEQALSQVELAKATLQLARATLTRAAAAARATPGSVSQQQLDRDQAAVSEAGARVKVAEAGATLARLELDFCKVTAPVAGRIGRALVDPGNVVRQDQTELAVLVREEPMYVHFNIGERTYLDLRRAQPDIAKQPVEIAVPGAKGFPLRGVLNFVNGFVDRETGGIEMRATVENKEHLLLPGMFVRVRLALRGPYKATLVRASAVKSSLERSHVYVVDAQDRVQVRAVTVGATQSDGLRVIARGLMPEDRVILGRLTGLQPGMAVKTRQVPMQRQDSAPPEENKSARQPFGFGGNVPARRPFGFGVTVDATYVGGEPQAVFANVGFPIEAQVNGLEGIRYLRSRCTSDGRYALDVAFASGVDLGRAQARVQDRVALALPRLPAAVRDVGIQVRSGTAGVLQIVSLTSTDPSHDHRFLGNFAAINIKNQLAREVGVADVAAIGGSEIGVRIRFDLDRFTAYGLSAAEVVRMLQKEKWPAGMKPWKMEELILRANEQGEVLRLRDVARVELGPMSTSSEATADGKPAVALVVYLASDANAAKVQAALAARLRELRDELPPGMALESDFDFAANFGWLRKSTSADCAVLDLDFDPALAGGTADVLAQCEAAVRAVPAVKHVLALSDNPFEVFGGRPCLLVQLNAAAPGKADRAETLRTVRRRLAALKDVTVRVRDLALLGSFPRCGYPIDAALCGPDAAEVRLWADKLAERLRKNDALADVWLNPDALPRPSYYVDINREQAAMRGVDLGDFYTTLEVFAGSVSLPPLYLFGRPVRVEVAASGRRADWFRALDNLKVRNARGQMIAASTFATVRATETPSALDFFNLLPMAQITANPATGVDLATARKLCARLAEETRRALRLPPEYRLAWLHP